MIYDYLIVGQGIGGTTLCYNLLKKGQSVCVIDPGIENATTVAAGNINPITGRSYTKTWLLDELLQEVNLFYREIEKLIGLSIIKDLEIYRTLRTIKDENRWMERVNNPSYSNYISSIADENELEKIINKPLSYGKIIGGYQIDTNNLINGYRNILKEKGIFYQESVDYNLFRFSERMVSYKEINAKRVVFSEGYSVVKNPFFNELPIVPTKGEVLIVNFKEKLTKSLRDTTFITPYGDNYWVGSNYDKTFIHKGVSEEGKLALQKKLDNSLLVDYTIKEHKAGIRPCVKDRKPILGKSEKDEGVYIFNGLGTKGTSLAPFFAKHFACYLVDETSLMSDVDIKRFIK